jgi:hypothetical protein
MIAAMHEYVAEDKHLKSVLVQDDVVVLPDPGEHYRTPIKASKRNMMIGVISYSFSA